MNKSLILCMAAMLSCFNLCAQQADTSEALFQARLATDSILLEALGGDKVDYGVFGRYGLDTARYNALASRFRACDTTLFGSDLLILYYGPAFREDYDGRYDRGDWEDLYAARNFSEAHASIRRELQTMPASPRLLLHALRSAIRCGRAQEECSAYGWQLSQIVGWLGFLSDGSKSHPIAVVTVLDEYAYLDWTMPNATVDGQSLEQVEGRFCDCLKLDGGESEIWFDVNLPFMANMKNKKQRMWKR